MQEVEGRCLTARDADNGASDLVKVNCIDVEFSESIQLKAGQRFVHWINPNEQGEGRVEIQGCTALIEARIWSVRRINKGEQDSVLRMSSYQGDEGGH